jgi:hypothetical protein
MGSSVSDFPPHSEATQGQRLPAARKVDRDRAIVIDRNKGLAWPVIAQRHGLSERQCRNVYGQWREVESERVFTRDQVEWVVERLAMFDSIIGSLAVIAEQADNSSARVGALRTQMAAMHEQALLLAATGLLPRDLRAFIDYEKVEAMIGRMAQVVERHDFSVEVIDDLLAVVEEQRNAPPWRPGRALNDRQPGS